MFKKRLILPPNITIWFIALVMMFVTTEMHAHQPDVSSTVLAQKDNATWMLEIRAAMTAFKYEVELENGKDGYSNPKEFKGLILDHIQEHIHIFTDDDADISLVEGVVRLAHETSVIFKVQGLENFNFIKVKNNSFENIPRNQSALVVLKKGFQQDQFVLSEKNDHTIKLKVDGNTIVADQEMDSALTSSSRLVPTITVLSILVFFYYLYWYFERS